MVWFSRMGDDFMKRSLKFDSILYHLTIDVRYVYKVKFWEMRQVCRGEHIADDGHVWSCDLPSS